MTESKKITLKIASELLTKISHAASFGLAQRISLSEVADMNSVVLKLINHKAFHGTNYSEIKKAKRHIHTLSERNGLYTFTDDNDKEQVGYILRDSEDNHAYREVCVVKEVEGHLYSIYTVHNCCLTKLEK